MYTRVGPVLTDIQSSIASRIFLLKQFGSHARRLARLRRVFLCQCDTSSEAGSQGEKRGDGAPAWLKDAKAP